MPPVIVKTLKFALPDLYKGSQSRLSGFSSQRAVLSLQPSSIQFARGPNPLCLRILSRQGLQMGGTTLHGLKSPTGDRQGETNELFST